jgi:hypothetical protein
MAHTRPDYRLYAAVAYHNMKWPEELYSGIMFFQGLRITIGEFQAVVHGRL